MFARNWPYQIGVCNNAGMAGKFGLVRNPALTRGKGHGTLGGWALAAGSNSPMKDDAMKFVELAMSRDWQLDHWNVFSRLSTRRDLAADTSLCTSQTQQSCVLPNSAICPNISKYLELGATEPKAVVPVSKGICPSIPHLATICDVDVNDYIVPRPATPSGDKYAAVSEAFWIAVNAGVTAAARGPALTKSE